MAFANTVRESANNMPIIFNMMRCGFVWTRVVPLLLLIGAASSASGQTSQPASSWSEKIAQLADALRGKEMGALVQLLDRGPIIRTFASDTLQPPERLLGATTGAKLLGVHAYSRLPSTLAADLSTDFSAATDVPETVRKDFIIPSEESVREANEIASRWITQILRPAYDEPIAVIILWRAERPELVGTSRPVFLLVRGQAVDGQFIIRQVSYGDPLDKPR